VKSHRHTVHRLRRLALGLATVAAILPASAGAVSPVSPSLEQHYRDALNGPARIGDMPADFAAAAANPVAPPVVEVVRPERTIVHDADQVLPIALSSAALLIVLMGAAFVLVRVRVQRRDLVGRPH
jgi:hypothetical protein